MAPATCVPAPRFSSPIAPALQRFLEWKRAAGYSYRAEAQTLGHLDRFLAHRLTAADPTISWDIIRAYVARHGEESETTRSHRMSLMRQVCRFLAVEQPQTPVPGPRFLEIKRTVFVPRVLTREEGRGGDPIRWTIDLSGFVLRSSSEKKMIDVGAVGISRSLRDFQTPVGAFCASTGVAASTSSSTSRKVSMA
jgi:hypothetical protein